MEQQDKLEKYVLENRSLFDNQDVPIDLFDKIDQQLNLGNEAKTNKKANHWLKYAAILILPVIAGILVLSVQQKNAKKDSISVKYSKNEVDPAMLNLIETESFYKSKIDAQYNKLQSLAASNPEISVEVSDMMKNLDENYKDLTKDLHDNLNKEVVINAMINQQRLQLQTLNDMINQIEISNN